MQHVSGLFIYFCNVVRRSVIARNCRFLLLLHSSQLQCRWGVYCTISNNKTFSRHIVPFFSGF